MLMIRKDTWANRQFKPRKRIECIERPRPCPFISCYYHIASMLMEKKVKKALNTVTIVWEKLQHRSGAWFPDEDLDEYFIDMIFSLPETCVLDIADKGDGTLEEIGDSMMMTRERVRQIEGLGRVKKGGAMRKLRHPIKARLLREYYEN